MQSAFQQEVRPRRHHYGFKAVWIGSIKDKFTVANESGLHLNAEKSQPWPPTECPRHGLGITTRPL